MKKRPTKVLQQIKVQSLRESKTTKKASRAKITNIFNYQAKQGR